MCQRSTFWRSSPAERAQQRIDKQIVDVPALQVLEGYPAGRAQQRIDKQIVDVPALQVLEGYPAGTCAATDRQTNCRCASAPNFRRCRATLSPHHVVDSSDRDRIEEANEELIKVPNEDEICDAAVLVFCANKESLLNAVKAAKVINKSGLHNLRKRVGHSIRLCRARNLSLTGC